MIVPCFVPDGGIVIVIGAVMILVPVYPSVNVAKMASTI